MTFDPELQIALDACRSSADDARDPALHADPRMAELAQRLAANPAIAERYAAALAEDGRLLSAVLDVPVPAGLESRLLSALALAAPIDFSASPSRTLNSARFMDRRRWLWSATAAAAAAAVLLAVGFWPRRPAYDLEALYRDVREFHHVAAVESAETLLSDDRPEGYAVADEVLNVDGPHTTWRKVKRLLGRSGVAYRLHSDEGTEATLYVVKLAHLPGAVNLSNLLPTQPPKRPSFTDNLTTAAWQHAPWAYLLVIEGPERHYRQFVREPRSLALHGGGRQMTLAAR